MEPLDISNIRDHHESKMHVGDDFVIDIENKEIVHIVNRHMDISMRSDYLRMLDGVYVPKPRRVQILASVYQIIEEYIDEER